MIRKLLTSICACTVALGYLLGSAAAQQHVPAAFSTAYAVQAAPEDQPMSGIPDKHAAALPGGAGPDACGDLAYENTYNGAPYYMDLWPGVHTADDCQLTGEWRDVCQVKSEIYNPNSTPGTVYIELWDVCPRQNGTLLATSAPLSAKPNGSTVVEWNLDPPVTVPETVWVGWRTTSMYVGPMVSSQAEVGYTNNYLYLTTCSGGPNCYCSWSQFWAGLDVTIYTAPLTHPGDLNCDGKVDFGDINPFVLALTDPSGYAQQFPDCNIMNADINKDGKCDFADINPFVDLLTQP